MSLANQHAPVCQPILVGGPSGVGKTTVISELIRLAPDRYSRPVSFTSRPRRPDEDTSEYCFISKSEILRLHEDGRSLNFDEVYGHYYGMDVASVFEQLRAGRMPIKEVHPENHAKIRNVFPDMLSVVILPYSAAKTVESRRTTEPVRNSQDEAYYSSIDVSSFDIILRPELNETAQQMAQRLDTYICVLTATQASFPRGPIIDAANRAGYNSVAPEFTDANRPTTRNFHSIQHNFFLESVNSIVPGERCLEIGPGQGWLRHTFVWPTVTYFGVDVSSEMVNHNNDNVHCLSVRSMPFREGEFDKVFASLGDPFCYPGALLEIARVLRRGGTFYLSAPCRTWSSGIRRHADAQTTSFRLNDGSTARVFSFTFDEGGLKELLSLCGFRVEVFESCTAATLKRRDLSPVLLQAAESVKVSVDELPVINVVKAVKGE